MKTRIKEESVIFISVIKWIILAAGVGIIVGLSTTLFVSSVNWGASIVSKVPYYLA